MRFLGLCAVIVLLCLIDVGGTSFREEPEDEELDIRDGAEYHRHHPRPRPGHHPQVQQYHPNRPTGNYHHHHHHPQVPYGHHQQVNPAQRPRHHHQRPYPRHVELQDDALSDFFEVDAEDDFP